MESNGTVCKHSGSLRGPLAASLLLHAALLSLLAFGLPRVLREPVASVEVRLVSLESEEGAGANGEEIGVGSPMAASGSRARPPAAVDRPAGSRAQEPRGAASPAGPAASAAPSIEPPAGEPPRAGPEPPAAPAKPAAPLPAATPPGRLAAPPPAPSAAAPTTSVGPLAAEGPKPSAPDLSLGTPSGFDVPQGPPAAGAYRPRQGGARAGGDTVGPEGAVGVRDGGGFAGHEGGGAPGTGGALARARGGGLGPGGGTDAPGEGTGTGGLSAGTFAHILRRIEAAKRYPEEARRLGHRGTVAVRFRIGSDGAVAAAEVAASSGSSLLDAASLDTVRQAAPLPAVPGWLRVRISYGLAEARP